MEWAGGHKRGVKKYCGKRSVPRAFTTPLSQMHLGLILGQRHVETFALPRTSTAISLTGHQMWRPEVGGGYIEGSTFGAAVVITSVALLKRSSPLPVTKVLTQEHTQWSREREKQQLPFKLRLMYRSHSKSEWPYLRPWGEARGCGRQNKETMEELNTQSQLICVFINTLNYQPLGPSHISMHTLSFVLFSPSAWKLCSNPMLIMLECLPD